MSSQETSKLASSKRPELLWPIAGVLAGALAAVNPFFEPRFTIVTVSLAWCVDWGCVLILSASPITSRAGVILSGLFLAVPCFLWSSALLRGVFLCCLALPFVISTFSLADSATISFPTRLGYFFRGLGKEEVNRRPPRFNLFALLHLIAATAVFAATMASVKAIHGEGWRWGLRWLEGGFMILAFAEMATASHDFLTALAGVTAPSLLRSPVVSVSLTEFWTRRWNPGASALLFHRFCYEPLARRSPARALVAAFAASAVLHVMVPYMATGRWGISLMCGGFFLVQPIFIGIERWLKVRRWRPAAGRAWALSILAITSPLFVEPALQIVEPSWGRAEELFAPVLAALGFALAVNMLVLVGSGRVPGSFLQGELCGASPRILLKNLPRVLQAFSGGRINPFAR